MNEEIIIPANLDTGRENKSILNYILENCLFAFDELCKVNNKLIKGMGVISKVDLSHSGAMNRMIQDYLIVRVGGLFDKTKGVISFEKLFSDNKEFKHIKEQKIIKYIIKQRNNFVAHTNKKHIKNNFPITAKICSSDLKELLENLQKVLKS